MEAPVSASTSVVNASAEEGPAENVVVTPAKNGGEVDSVTVKPLMVLVDSRKSSNDIEIIKRRLLIDGDGVGDEKKLIRLTETYYALLNDDSILELRERMHVIAYYRTFQTLLKQTDGIRSNVTKTYKAIVANTKASAYWELIQESIAKEIAEMKVFVKALRQHHADVERNRKECQEREALVKLLNQVPERHENEKKIKKLAEEYGQLLVRQAELDEQVNAKKMYLDYLCELVKRLDCEDMQIAEEAVTETEEKVLSDVSTLDLE